MNAGSLRLARKFLILIAAIIFLVLLAGVVWTLKGNELLRAALVPSTEFKAPPPIVTNAYADSEMWLARPGLKDNPATWRPEKAPLPVSRGKAAIFFVHPTSAFDRDEWNVSVKDPDAAARARLFVQGQASVFSEAGEIWAPRYRQATFGAFLTDAPEGRLALDAAYRDVAEAFDAFLAANPGKPVILAGHSQGALHVSRLLQDRVAGTKLQSQVIAAYVIGWPISVAADLPALGLPACAKPDETKCIISYVSFAEPADPGMVVEAFEASPGLVGIARVGPILCTNPLTGSNGGDAPLSASAGMLKTADDFSAGEIVTPGVPARCDAKGILLIGEGPKLGPYVLPGNNYHVFDYSLFWPNLVSDVKRRAAAFRAK